MAYIDYLFEGQNNLQFNYKKVDDDAWLDKGINHGSKLVTKPKRFDLKNKGSKLLQPGAVVNETQKKVIAFMFVEWYAGAQNLPFEDKSDPWTLAAFKKRNEPYYEYIDVVD